MKLSIVLVNYRGWKRLWSCLESLRCLKDAAFSWEVIVVDNNSADGQLSKFKADFPEFIFVENPRNGGFANGCNVGAAQSTGQYIFFLNPDTEITLEAVQQLIETAGQHPEITILSCRQLNDDGKDTRPYGYFIKPATMTSFLRSVYSLSNKLKVEFLDQDVSFIYPEWVSGSVIFMERKKFEELGRWSEDFWMYFEDMDLCKRARQSGGTIAIANTIQIIHNHGGSSRVNIDVRALTKSEVLISKHIYISKHFSHLKRWLMQLYLVCNNLLLSQLAPAIIGLVFYFIPVLRVYPKLYFALVKYYGNVVTNRTWISPRSVNYKMNKLV